MFASYTRPLFFALVPSMLYYLLAPSISTAAPGLSTNALNESSPNCHIESKNWCGRGESCYVLEYGFKCDHWQTMGWVIDRTLNIYFSQPPYNHTLPTSGACTLLPIPTNTTLQDLLIVAMKRWEAYYRSSTIFISDNPTSILEGYSDCNDVHQRCVDDQCVPVLPLGSICKANSECYNPPLNNSNNTQGPICEYLAGHLEDPPRCINYIQVPGHPDNDPSLAYPIHRRSRVWIYVVVALLGMVIMLAIFFYCRRSQQVAPSMIDRAFDDGDHQQQAIDGPINEQRRLSTAASIRHEKDMELDQAFLSRIGHNRQAHQTEKLWGNAILGIPTAPVQIPVSRKSFVSDKEPDPAAEAMGATTHLTEEPPAAPGIPEIALEQAPSPISQLFPVPGSTLDPESVRLRM